jgi:hypothetical protein
LGGTVTCYAQTGSFSNREYVSQDVHSFTAAAPGDYMQLTWVLPEINAVTNGTTLALTCRMSPGTRIGTIRHIYSIPA